MVASTAVQAIAMPLEPLRSKRAASRSCATGTTKYSRKSRECLNRFEGAWKVEQHHPHPTLPLKGRAKDEKCVEARRRCGRDKREYREARERLQRSQSRETIDRFSPCFVRVHILARP